MLIHHDNTRLYPKTRVNHKRALSEISKLWKHFDESRAHSIVTQIN